MGGSEGTTMADRFELSVDNDVCEANALCIRSAPDLFELDDEDVLHVLVGRPTGEQVALARQAVDGCPKQALTLRGPDD